MKLLQSSAFAIAALALAGCAGSVSAPTAIQPLSMDQKANLHIADVTADAATGVDMSDADFAVICQKVKGYVQSEAPSVMADSGYKMKVHFTRFDRGNAFARAMLAGLGQIRIEATVDLVDTSGASVAQYNVSKDFALGGMVGGSTSVEDVEDGFAKSVAEIVKAKG